MAKRKFDIWFDEYDWQIAEDTLDSLDDKTIKDTNKYYGFAVSKISKDGLVFLCAAHKVTDNELENLKDEKLFNEIAIFKHKDKSFEGTIINALEYVQKEFMNE